MILVIGIVRSQFYFFNNLLIIGFFFPFFPAFIVMIKVICNLSEITFMLKAIKQISSRLLREKIGLDTQGKLCH